MSHDGNYSPNGRGATRPLVFRYRFALGNGQQRVFEVRLARPMLTLELPQRESYPEWTRLNCHQCPNCPLNEWEHPRCPIAAALVDIVEFFRDTASYEEVEVTIETEARIYMKHTTVQQAASSLIGIHMVVSGCPIMEKLKPMVPYHLPFATPEETTYRVVSMYLLAQYFLHRQGKEADWDLKYLPQIYDDIRTVNTHFVKRLLAAGINDASLNAVVVLDTLAAYVTYPGDENLLNRIEPAFHAYFQ